MVPVYKLTAPSCGTNRDVLVRLLEQVGAGTRTAASGLEALEAARDRQPDIVLMDISMPGLDGRQTFQALSEEHGGGLPAVAVTASVFEHQRQEYLGLGFRAVLDKPVRAARLYACLAEELGVGFEFAAGEVQDETPGQDLLPAELPTDLLDELHQAASGHNITRLRPALDRLKALGPAYDDLAAELEAATRRYDMEAITRLLDKTAAK